MWGFVEQNPRSVENYPKNDQFFQDDTTGMPGALIRELTQNSLDAVGRSGGAVTVVISNTRIDAARFRDRYTQGLAKHLAACGKEDNPAAQWSGETIPVLLLEDMGTKGLEGAYDKRDPNGAFYAFWRQYGHSAKKGESGGRHGLGKSVFSNASKQRFFFGLTIRESDSKCLLLGQAVLIPHEIDETIYEPYGIYSPSQEDKFPLPYEGEAAAQFREDFQLHRRDQPGLSLAIPLPHEELTEERMVQASIEHCFFQICAGQLIMEIGAERLDQSRIEHLTEQHCPHLLEAVSLALDIAKHADPTSWFKPKTGPLAGEWSGDDFEDADLQEMRRRYEAGKAVSVRVDVPVQRKDQEEPNYGAVDFHLKRVGRRDLAHEAYLRGRVSVPRQQKMLVGADSVGFAVVEPGPLSDFLGDAEPPAHDRWLLVNVKESYSTPEKPMHAVKYGLRALERIVTGEDEEEEASETLGDFFWEPDFDPDKKTREGVDTGDNDVDVPPPEDHPPFFDLGKKDGGFVVSYPSDASREAPPTEVKVGYALRGSKAVKWSPVDFTFNSTEVAFEKSGEGDYSARDNVIVITDAQPGFRLAVSGFDPNRDLRVVVAEAAEMEVEDGEAP